MPVDSPDTDDFSDDERGEGDDSGAEQQPKRRQRGAAAAAPKRRKSQADRDCVNPAASRARRVRDNVRTSKILDVLKARADIAAEMINYIVLQQPQEVRDRLRELGFVQLERFAAVRDVRAKSLKRDLNIKVAAARPARVGGETGGAILRHS